MVQAAAQPAYYKDKEYNPETAVNPLVKAIGTSLINSTLSQFPTVIFLVVATHANGWKLDRKFGAVLMVWYLLFITLASLYELNVFGNYQTASPFINYLKNCI